MSPCLGREQCKPAHICWVAVSSISNDATFQLHCCDSTWAAQSMAGILKAHALMILAFDLACAAGRVSPHSATLLGKACVEMLQFSVVSRRSGLSFITFIFISAVWHHQIWLSQFLKFYVFWNTNTKTGSINVLLTALQGLLKDLTPHHKILLDMAALTMSGNPEQQLRNAATQALTFALGSFQVKPLLCPKVLAESICSKTKKCDSCTH